MTAVTCSRRTSPGSASPSARPRPSRRWSTCTGGTSPRCPTRTSASCSAGRRSVDPAASLARVGETGRAGYCFHQNGALEIALRELGFDGLAPARARVDRRGAPRPAPTSTTSSSSSTGLPTDRQPGRAVVAGRRARRGLGGPAAAGRRHGSGTATSRSTIEAVDDDGLVLRAPRRPARSAASRCATCPSVRPRCRPRTRRCRRRPTGAFTRVLVVQRRDRRPRRHAALLRAVPVRARRPDADRRDDVRRLACGADRRGRAAARRRAGGRAAGAVSSGCALPTRSGTQPDGREDEPNGGPSMHREGQRAGRPREGAADESRSRG